MLRLGEPTGTPLRLVDAEAQDNQGPDYQNRTKSPSRRLATDGNLHLSSMIFSARRRILSVTTWYQSSNLIWSPLLPRRHALGIRLGHSRFDILRPSSLTDPFGNDISRQLCSGAKKLPLQDLHTLPLLNLEDRSIG